MPRAIDCLGCGQCESCIGRSIAFAEEMEKQEMGDIKYPFTEEEFAVAYEAWGCNCGPTSLAFALQVKLDAVRGMIPGFEEKRYTSPSMMKAALRNLKREYKPIDVTGERSDMFSERMSLVRIQWCGPWTAPGANPKWAYRQTHWIATWRTRLSDPLATAIMGGDVLCPPTLFDCNGGMMRFERWEKEIVPVLTASYPRADGSWFPTHIWRLL